MPKYSNVYYALNYMLHRVYSDYLQDSLTEYIIDKTNADPDYLRTYTNFITYSEEAWQNSLKWKWTDETMKLAECFDFPCQVGIPSHSSLRAEFIFHDTGMGIYENMTMLSSTDAVIFMVVNVTDASVVMQFYRELYQYANLDFFVRGDIIYFKVPLNMFMYDILHRELPNNSRKESDDFRKVRVLKHSQIKLRWSDNFKKYFEQLVIKYDTQKLCNRLTTGLEVVCVKQPAEHYFNEFEMPLFRISFKKSLISTGSMFNKWFRSFSHGVPVFVIDLTYSDGLYSLLVQPSLGMYHEFVSRGLK